MMKRKLGVLSANVLNAGLSTEDDNRKATKSAGRASDLFTVAQELCTGVCVCSCTVQHPCESGAPLVITSTLFFLPPQL